MSSYSFTSSQLDAFKRVWPCHGIPDEVTQLRFEFDQGGDIVGLWAGDFTGATADTEPFDGPALVALADDARTLADGGEVPWWTPFVTYAELKGEYRLSACGDPYGTVMGWWFAVAGELFERGEEVPADWNYRVDAGGGRELGSYEASVCLEATTEALLQFGTVLERACRLCKAAGIDY